MRRVLLLILPLLVAQNALAFDQQSLMRVFFSVVLVRGYDLDGNLAYGSGIVVDTNKVATNCHVLRRTTKAWVSQGEETYPIKSVQADPRHDLCLLNFDDLPLKPVVVGSTADLHNGDEVFAMGHSNGVLAPQASGGQIRSLYPFDDGNVIRTSARFTLGASGSPLFDDKGRLVGINTFKTPGKHAYFYAVPVEWLRRVAQTAPQTGLPISGQTFWELPDADKPFFMQVALPHLNKDWETLQGISERWVAAEPENSEAWYELGTARERLGRLDEAHDAYTRAVALNPQHGESLFRLGLFASRRGDDAELQSIMLALTSLDRAMADDFRKAVGCTAEC